MSETTNMTNNMTNKSNKTDTLVRDKYNLLVELGKGSFGEVYLIEDRKTQHRYAMKIESRSTKSRLKEEFNIYVQLIRNGVNKGIPKIINFFEASNYDIMVMELLGDSLDQLFIKHNKRFDMGTVLKLGVDMINLMETIHNAGFIHRDIKPNNFMIGYHNKQDLYILDFGLSKQYMINNKHMTMKFDKSLVGTARYASVNVHIGIEPSRRDDLISIGYLLIYFLKGRLPWQGLKKKKENKTNKEDQLTMIKNVKLSTSFTQLCEGLQHQCFEEYITYCSNELDFYTKPDYEYLRQLFINAAKVMGVELRYNF